MGLHANPLVVSQERSSRARAALKYTPQYSAQKAKKPNGFTPAEAKHFERLSKNLDDIGVNSENFEQHIISCAEFMAIRDELKDNIAKLKRSKVSMTYDVHRPNGDIVPTLRPEYEFLARVDEIIRKYHAAFGLSPAAHASLGIRRSLKTPGGRKVKPAAAATGDWGEL